MKKISNESGFTIIEVVLVLAIIGLILVSIFIGLPALQRAQRDAQRRNDAARVFNAALEYINNTGEAPFKIEYKDKNEIVNGQPKIKRDYNSVLNGETLDLDFITKYVDSSCTIKDNNPQDKGYYPEDGVSATNLYGYIGMYGDRAYKFKGSCNEFRDPNGEIYILTVLDGDGDGFKPGEDNDTNHNHIYATAGSKCTNNESVRAHTSLDKSDRSTLRHNDIAVWVKLELGSTYCIDNQTQGRK